MKNQVTAITGATKHLNQLLSEKKDPRCNIFKKVFAANKTAYGIEQFITLEAETHLGFNKDLIWLGHEKVAEEAGQVHIYKLLFTIKTNENEKSKVSTANEIR